MKTLGARVSRHSSPKSNKDTNWPLGNYERPRGDYAGSLVYEKTGKLEYVQHFLGHADLKTTMEWYHYLLGETPALDMADFALPVKLEVVAGRRTN